MEWVLQVLDEADDAAAAARQWWLRAAPEMETLLAAGWGCSVFAVANLFGAGPTSLAIAALGFSAAVAISMRQRVTRYNANC